MYILAILAVILSTVFMMGISGFGGSVMRYLDAPSLIVLLILIIPILAASNMLKDFNNAFRITLKKTSEASYTEIKRALEAVKVVMKTLLYGGVFNMLFSLVMMTFQMTDLSAVGPNVVVAMLGLIYALVGNLILIPIQARLKIKMMEFMQE